MTYEITTEVLAKAINETKETVQIKTETVTLEIQDQKIDFQIILKAASDKNNQLNAMAIAPIVNGQPDYQQVAVVFAGTNMPQETGATGFGTAIDALSGSLSGEYYLAEAFLKQTQKKLAQQNGTITDVAGFSQAGGYMMKMAAVHGQSNGFKTTSFDDWGNNQFATLTKAEQQWLNTHPEAFSRFQNDSWAEYSLRDHTYGNVFSISGVKGHHTLAKYFDGDLLHLERLAEDGIFAPNMTQAQVEKAAKIWAKKNGDGNPLTNDETEAKQRMQAYLKQYGYYSTVDFHAQWTKLNQLRKAFKASGGSLSANEEIYLDNHQALLTIQAASQTMKAGLAAMIAIYQAAIVEAEQLWTEGFERARLIGTDLSEIEIIEALASVGATQLSVVTEPTAFYEEKIAHAKQIGESFDQLISDIKSGIARLVESDRALASQIG